MRINETNLTIGHLWLTVRFRNKMDVTNLWHLLAILAHLSSNVTAKPSRNSSNKGCDKTIRTTRMVRSPRVTSANRGKPVHCVYRLVKYGVGDLVFELNFKAFHVSVHHNATWCSSGYLQIVDSASRANTSGYFCGKLQHSRTFLAETDQVTLVFHSDSYNRQTHFRVQISALPKRLAQERHKELVLDNPGETLAGTYCDRRYVNCHGFCDVTSPRYPGFYPRNATCRYHVTFNETDNARVVLGGQYYDNFDVWGGPWSSSRCHSNYCSSKEITTLCPYDRLTIYDVTAAGGSTLIQTFCGRGHLPRIISRGQEIVLEFASSVAGSIANDGFHLSIGTEARREYLTASEVTPEGACHWEFDSRVATQGQFQNLRHWYAPGTRCSYKFLGQADQRVFLHFVNFNANRDEACRSKLALYDSEGPDGGASRGVFCGRHQPPETLLSSSSRFYVEFDSKLGSYDGSNFEYSLLYTFVETRASGHRLNGTACDETFSSSDGGAPARQGAFDFFRERLRLRRRHVTCTFRFRGRDTERVRITFTGLRFDATKGCGVGQRPTDRCAAVADDLAFDSLAVLDDRQQVVECLCGSTYLPHVVVSGDAYLELRLTLRDVPALAYRDAESYAFRGRYEFLQVGCGESRLTGRQGELLFPTLQRHLLPALVHCRWTIEVAEGRSVLLKFAHFSMGGDCASEHLLVGTSTARGSHQRLCRENAPREIVPSAEGHKIVLELNSTSLTSFQLLWTEISVAVGADQEQSCDYECPGGRYCIAYDLVCNGVINCPATNFTWDPLDESVADCATAGAILQWVLLTFSSSFAVVLLIAASVIWRKKYCHDSE